LVVEWQQWHTESVATCKFISFAPARHSNGANWRNTFRSDLCLFCCAHSIDIKIGLRERIVLVRYCANIDGLLLLLAFPTQWTFRLPRELSKSFHTLLCLIYICATQTTLIHFSRFFFTIAAAFGGDSRWHNPAHEFHMSRKGHGLLRRCRGGLSGLSYVRRTGSTVQLPLSECDALPAANVNLRSLVHGRLPVIGGELRL
jgi:hypothetical protein